MYVFILHVYIAYDIINIQLMNKKLIASDSKESAYNAGDLSLIPGLGRSPWEGHGNPLQYSCLENFMDQGAWQGTVQGVNKSWTQLNN